MLIRTPTQHYTTDDVKQALGLLGLECDAQTLAKFSDDGAALLSRVKTTASVRTRLGVKSYGQALYVVDTLERVRTSYTPLAAMPAFTTKPLACSSPAASWTVEDVCDWLRKLGLADLEPVFRQHSVDGWVLLQLKLEEFGLWAEAIAEHDHVLEPAIAILRADGEWR